jgi:hypothetical protein
MKIDVSDIVVYYRSLQALNRLTEDLLKCAHEIYRERDWSTATCLESHIDCLGTGGYFAHLSQQVDNHPLWGLNDIAELERVGTFSHVYRLTCPTLTLPLIWRKMAPSWSTAVLNFCALGVLGVMAGLSEKDIVDEEMCPPWSFAKPMSLSRLASDPEKFVSSICEHFTADVRRQLSVARVMLDREASWVYLEMLKSRIIEETPDNLLIGDSSKLAKVDKALREMFWKDPKMKQAAIAKKLSTQKLGIKTTALVDILRGLRGEGVYQGEERSPRK